jgi:DNA-binding MarR family transcriptional regulator
LAKKATSKVENSFPTNIDHVDIDVLENTLSFYIRVIDSSVSRDLDERLEKLEVAKGKGKITALFLIDSHPGIRPSVVAELAMKDRSAMGRILDLFEKQGLIERRTSWKTVGHTSFTQQTKVRRSQKRCVLSSLNSLKTFSKSSLRTNRKF